MTTFKQYLLTEGRTQQIDLEQAIYYVSNDCKQYLEQVNNGNIIYRGIRKLKTDYGYIVPAEHNQRMSAHTENYYTMLINNLPNWKQYPKREVICTTNVMEAKSRGDVYVMFPPDWAAIGVCPKGDIWESFKTLQQQYKIRLLDDFNYVYEEITRALLNRNPTVHNWKQFKAQLKRIDHVIQHDEIENVKKELSKSAYKMVLDAKNLYDDSLTTLLQNVFDPNTNGFTEISAGNFDTDIDREVWFDTAAVLVHKDHLFDFVAKAKEHVDI